MATIPDKLIVSNRAQLVAKYGPSGANVIVKAVQALIKADAARGIVSVFVDLSDGPTMAGYGAQPIPASQAGDARRNKQEIDKVFTAYTPRPSYLLLLGSVDVIPHVALANPVPGDGDANVPSDLPYACDAPYSDAVQDFTGPSRVVGRLPDVTNGQNPAYLAGLLATASSYRARPVSDYGKFLGISADVWKKSTALSLQTVFGTHNGMKISPPDGYKWSATDAKRLSQFINCHGAAADPQFYGQKGGNYPVAHSAAWMAGKVVAGTVLAAECCYGAELYDPALATAGGQIGMCNTYLERQAYAYFGSSTIAYGPSTTNDQADLICQYFFNEVRSGGSVGRSCLQARLSYVNKKGGVLTPVDLKTLAQFNLMADPALTPVAVPFAAMVISAIARAKALGGATAALRRYGRLGRRAVLASAASATYRLSLRKGEEATSKAGPPAKVMELASQYDIADPDVVLTYDVTAPSDAKGIMPQAAMDAAAAASPQAIHVVLKHLEAPKDAPRLTLIRGLQAIEYEVGMVAQVFESR